MKCTVAVILVVVAMIQAEVPRGGLPRQVAAPYMARGWRPEGQPLFLPLRNQKQVDVPQQEARRPTDEPESTTTPRPRNKEDASEEFTEQQAENVVAVNQSKKSPGKPEKLEIQPDEEVQQVQQVQQVQPVQQVQQVQPVGQPQYYVVVPQGQNLMYSVQPQNLVAVQMAAAPVQQAARLQVVPQVSSTGVFTPFSSQFVQIYQ